MNDQRTGFRPSFSWPYHTLRSHLTSFPSFTRSFVPRSLRSLREVKEWSVGKRQTERMNEGYEGHQIITIIVQFFPAVTNDFLFHSPRSYSLTLRSLPIPFPLPATYARFGLLSLVLHLPFVTRSEPWSDGGMTGEMRGGNGRNE